MSEFEILDGKVIDSGNGTRHILSAGEIWSQRKNDFALDNRIEILGYGNLSIRIPQVTQEWTRVMLQVEGKEFVIPRRFFPLIDYVVVEDKFWVPLHEGEVSTVNNLVTTGHLIDNNYLRARMFVELLKLKHAKELDIQIPPGAINSIQFSTEALESPRLKVQPYPYQESGMKWLISLYCENIGGILADQMGLGKTIQLIALALFAVSNPKSLQSRILIVVPNSLLENWQSEFTKFAPYSYAPYLHAGLERERNAQLLGSKDIVLTSYDVLNRDIYFFRELEWGLIICDEAQSLKNPRTQRHLSVSSLKSTCKFLATGTPVENNLLDLWSLMEIIYPGVMGDMNFFRSLYQGSLAQAMRVGEEVKPLILRRKTRDVLKELPPEVKIDEFINPTEEFVEFYEYVRTEGLRSPGVSNMEAIQTLRQLCCYPPIVLPEVGSISDAKVDRLLEILDNIYSQSEEKVIIFTNFHDSADFLMNLLTRQFPDVFICILDGRVRERTQRSEILREFDEVAKFAILIASPRVAGEGLNITSANHVIHYNLDWNPQKEDQASARVSRPGQRRTCFIHRLIYRNTIEEYIHGVMIGKRAISDAVLEATENEASSKSLKEALAMTPLAGRHTWSSEKQSSPLLNITWLQKSRRDDE